MNADPRVMEWFPTMLSSQESAGLVGRIEQDFEDAGYGLWAVELARGAEFIGFTGLSDVHIDVPFAPAVEVGWRLAHKYWGRGYATEAARTALTFGFTELDLGEIVSFTAAANLRSQRVMERLRMTRGAEFDHPSIPEDHPLRPHVLYAARRGTWDRSSAGR
jgi:RimJ/RimL family protein N-acetyltransferase